MFDTKEKEIKKRYRLIRVFEGRRTYRKSFSFTNTNNILLEKIKFSILSAKKKLQ